MTTIPDQLFNRRLERWLHLGVWFFFLLVYAFLFNRFLPFGMSFTRGLANILPLAMLFYLNFYLVDRFLERRQYRVYFLSILGLFLLFTGIRTQINLLFPDFTEEMLRQSERFSWQVGAVATNFMALVISTFYQILYNNYQREQRNLAVIKEQQEAELQFLRAQINPHFLFNILNNIYSLAVVRSEQTAPMVLQLSNLLRYVIYDSRREQVELDKEVRHIQQYIDLFRMRSEAPLDISFTTKGSWENKLIEPMILIPLVENCFKHCDFATNPAAYVRIGLEMNNGTLFFHTINTKNDEDRQKDQQGGVGLENIRRRLELKYRDRYELEVIPEKKSFAVKLRLQS